MGAVEPTYAVLRNAGDIQGISARFDWSSWDAITTIPYATRSRVSEYSSNTLSRCAQMTATPSRIRLPDIV